MVHRVDEREVVPEGVQGAGCVEAAKERIGVPDQTRSRPLQVGLVRLVPKDRLPVMAHISTQQLVEVRAGNEQEPDALFRRQQRFQCVLLS